MTTAPLRHAIRCADPDIITRRGAHGDELEICRTCGRFGLAQPPVEPAPEPTMPRSTSRYRCGEHTDAPVTARQRLPTLRQTMRTTTGTGEPP